MENVAIYARYSSHSQTEASIEGQLKVCHEYAERNNLKIVHEYIDRALSGTSDKRPEFQQMIKDSDHKMFDYVLVYQLDRFARDRYDSATYKHKLKKNGVRVISAKENISNDASGVLMEAYSVEDDGKGICFCVYVYNIQPGIEIDYRTGESHEI